MNDDRSLLQRAIKLAEEGISKGHGPFGAVIALDGEIIAEASNSVVKSGDPTAHAEILAIREAASFLRTHDLSSCVLYTSCEPCPMCLGAIYWSGIRKVVYAADRHDAEKSGFSDKFIYDELMLDPGSRKIEFVRLPDEGGEKVFREWDNFENKVPY
jgi:tRNA(Arg) A34 adenosine deaminase TadA